MNSLTRNLLLLAALTVLSGSVAALAPLNGTYECNAEACITSAPESPDQPVANNSTGQEIEGERVNLTINSKTCSSGENDTATVNKYYKMESYPPQHRIEFSGTFISSTPCRTLDYSLSEKNGIYTLNIVEDERAGGACIECVGAISYTAEVDIQAEYLQLEILHDGRKVNSFAPPQDINTGGLGPEHVVPEQGVLPGIFNWLRGLLGF